MTKTQTKLLELASNHGGSYSITTCYGRGPKGGRVNAGIRERDAIFTLVKLGLIEITDRQPWSETSHGYTQSGNSIAFKVK